MTGILTGLILPPDLQNVSTFWRIFTAFSLFICSFSFSVIVTIKSRESLKEKKFFNQIIMNIQTEPSNDLQPAQRTKQVKSKVYLNEMITVTKIRVGLFKSHATLRHTYFFRVMRPKTTSRWFKSGIVPCWLFC